MKSPNRQESLKINQNKELQLNPSNSRKNLTGTGGKKSKKKKRQKAKKSKKLEVKVKIDKIERDTFDFFYSKKTKEEQKLIDNLMEEDSLNGNYNFENNKGQEGSSWLMLGRKLESEKKIRKQSYKTKIEDWTSNLSRRSYYMLEKLQKKEEKEIPKEEKPKKKFSSEKNLKKVKPPKMREVSYKTPIRVRIDVEKEYRTRSSSTKRSNIQKKVEQDEIFFRKKKLKLRSCREPSARKEKILVGTISSPIYNLKLDKYKKLEKTKMLDIDVKMASQIKGVSFETISNEKKNLENLMKRKLKRKKKLAVSKSKPNIKRDLTPQARTDYKNQVKSVKKSNFKKNFSSQGASPNNRKSGCKIKFSKMFKKKKESQYLAEESYLDSKKIYQLPKYRIKDFRHQPESLKSQLKLKNKKFSAPSLNLGKIKKMLISGFPSKKKQRVPVLDRLNSRYSQLKMINSKIGEKKFGKKFISSSGSKKNFVKNEKNKNFYNAVYQDKSRVRNVSFMKKILSPKLKGVHYKLYERKKGKKVDLRMDLSLEDGKKVSIQEFEKLKKSLEYIPGKIQFSFFMKQFFCFFFVKFFDR